MPALNFLYCDDDIPEYFLVKNLNSLRKAYINVGPTEEQFEGPELERYLKVVADLVVGCSNVEFLSLPNVAIAAVSCTFPSMCPFPNLIELEFHYIGAHGWKMLPGFLKNAANLEVLLFTEGFHVHEGCYEIFMSQMAEQFPTWLFLKLQRIKFERFGGEVDILHLIKYFLKNAKVLRKIEISLSSSCPAKAASKVLALRKRTKNCYIDIIPTSETDDDQHHLSFGMREFE